MGVSHSSKKKCNHNPNFIQNASYIKIKCEPKLRKRTPEHIVELLYELPNNRKEYFRRCDTEDCIPSTRVFRKNSQIQKTNSSSESSLEISLEQTASKGSKTFLNNYHADDSKKRENCILTQDSDILQTKKSIPLITTLHPKSIDLAKQNSAIKLRTQSKVSFKEELSNRLENNTQLISEQITEKKSQAYINTLPLKLPKLDKLSNICTMSDDHRPYTTKYIDKDGKTVGVSATFYEDVAQPSINKFWYKFSPKLLSLKKRLSEDYYNYRQNSKHENLKYKMMHPKNPQSNDLERSLETQTIGGSQSLLNLPYRSSSLIIVPSPSFSSQEISPTVELSEKCNGKVQLGLQDIQVNRSIQTFTKNIQEEVKLKVIETQTEQHHHGQSAVSVKVVDMLQQKYKKNFKTLNELLKLPPKYLILLLTSGELVQPPLTVKPTMTLISFKQIVNSIKSGI